MAQVFGGSYAELRFRTAAHVRPIPYSPEEITELEKQLNLGVTGDSTGIAPPPTGGKYRMIGTLESLNQRGRCMPTAYNTDIVTKRIGKTQLSGYLKDETYTYGEVLLKKCDTAGPLRITGSLVSKRSIQQDKYPYVFAIGVSVPLFLYNLSDDYELRNLRVDGTVVTNYVGPSIIPTDTVTGVAVDLSVADTGYIAADAYDAATGELMAADLRLLIAPT